MSMSTWLSPMVGPIVFVETYCCLRWVLFWVGDVIGAEFGGAHVQRREEGARKGYFRHLEHCMRSLVYSRGLGIDCLLEPEHNFSVGLISGMPLMSKACGKRTC